MLSQPTHPVLTYITSTVDPHLFELLVSGRLDYPDWTMTVLLEYFDRVCGFIRVLKQILHINVLYTLTYQLSEVVKSTVQLQFKQ